MRGRLSFRGGGGGGGGEGRVKFACSLELNTDTPIKVHDLMFGHGGWGAEGLFF